MEHSFSITPKMISVFGCNVKDLLIKPRCSSLAPITTFDICDQFKAPQHITQGSSVTYIVQSCKYFPPKKLAADVIADFGKIDILINNAGITRDNLMLRMSKDDWDTIINVNLNSVFNLTKAVIKPMMKARSGSIINMTSVVGVKGNAGQANYAASKAGVIGFSKSIALELGSRNIRCNAIAPGFIETEMTAALDEKTVQGWRDSIPLKRGGQPEDVANACVFLASDMSTYISGQVLNVDGGMLT